MSIVCGPKIYIIEQRLRRSTEASMQEEQAAFRKNRQTQDHICTLRTVIDKMLATNRDLYIAFMDIASAFDNVRRTEVWNLLRTRKVSGKLTAAIEKVYKKAKGRVRLNGRESNTFEWTKGIKQGDSLSPLLFNLIMDQITKDSNNELRQKKTDITTYNQYMSRP